MYNHLINFIDANKILYNYQFGYRKSHSQTMLLYPFKINNAMDSGKISIGVFWIKEKHSILLIIVSSWLQTTQHTSGGAVIAD